MPVSVLLRADASVEAGSGHVMRCLTLADTLAQAGAVCRFISRDLPGHRADLIASRGHGVDLLPPPPEPRPDTSTDAPRHASWLPVGQADDARACAETLGGTRTDCIVVDHYALDARWERAVRPLTGRILAIDDLADRPHDCDILLDQNLGRRAADYDGLVPPGARRLIGPDFALLAPGFAAAREESLARRKHPAPERLLVSLGGVDPGNVTGRILDSLAALNRPPVRHVDVILGAAAPWKDDIRARLGSLPVTAELHVDTTRMPELMTKADLAIGAGGGTSWERCCLGLPSLIVVIAENQAPAARALVSAGAALTLDPSSPIRLGEALARLRDSGTLAAMSQAAAALCDGMGAERLSRALLASLPDLRPATMDDAADVWEWRHAGGAARYYRSGAETPFPDHLRWFAAAVADADRTLLVATLRGTPIAHLRFDRCGDTTAEVSICMAPAARGHGLARACLEAGLAHAAERGMTRVTADVHADNGASLRLFEGAGFGFRCRDGEFITYERALEAMTVQAQQEGPPDGDREPQDRP